MPSPRNVRAFRAAVALAAPLVIALVPLFWIADGTRRASVTPLARDQGIFNYIAWAISNGAVDYRDVRDVNGPLSHFVHWIFLKLGGADDHRFRVIDLTVSAIAFAFVGACVPMRARARPVERAAWALAACVALMGQYLAFNYWDTAQRESFFDWFMLASVALEMASRGDARALAVSGALSIVPWFGKPTFVLFTIAQLAAIAIDRGDRKRAFRAFAIGGAIGAATQIAFLIAKGDVGAWLRITASDVPAMYRFIWARSAADIFSGAWYANRAIFGMTGAAVMLALIALGKLPRRALAVALLPLAAIAGIVVQAKGFPYHFHPLTAAIYLQWLVVGAWMWERARAAPRARGVALAFAAAIALRVATEMAESPYMKEVWLVEGAATAEQRATKEYFARFPEPDYFPYDLREAAAFLRARTAPNDRVQMYGMDPLVLFLAGRASATPYILAYDLNADVALGGGTAGRPTEAQSARIRAIRDAHARDLDARLRASPPAAFVFVDKSPLVSDADAWKDFERHCPDTAAWVEQDYEEAAVFGVARIWLKR